MIAARTVSIDIFSHSLSKARFSDSKVRCCFLLTLASKIPQTEKSSGFKSGLDGGHSSDEMNFGQFSRHHFDQNPSRFLLHNFWHSSDPQKIFHILTKHMSTKNVKHIRYHWVKLTRNYELVLELSCHPADGHLETKFWRNVAMSSAVLYDSNCN